MTKLKLNDLSGAANQSIFFSVDKSVQLFFLTFKNTSRTEATVVIFSGMDALNL